MAEASGRVEAIQEKIDRRKRQRLLGQKNSGKTILDDVPVDERDSSASAWLSKCANLVARSKKANDNPIVKSQGEHPAKSTPTSGTVEKKKVGKSKRAKILPSVSLLQDEERLVFDGNFNEGEMRGGNIVSDKAQGGKTTKIKKRKKDRSKKRKKFKLRKHDDELLDEGTSGLIQKQQTQIQNNPGKRIVKEENDEVELDAYLARARRLASSQNRTAFAPSHFLKTNSAKLDAKKVPSSNRVDTFSGVVSFANHIAERLEKSTKNVNITRDSEREDLKLKKQAPRKEVVERAVVGTEASEPRTKAQKKDNTSASRSVNSIMSTLNYLRQSNSSKEEVIVGRANDKILRNEKGASGKEIKLEYRDDLGRLMTPKEAFRQLSYNFHGIKPSKKTREKRGRQMEKRFVRTKNT